ncbi:hypothetical protein HA402_014279 [Bradysia odoriphaga]|nr:hypothetical protein HA402_014279 [Bradysia odoriphaga]
MEGATVIQTIYERQKTSIRCEVLRIVRVVRNCFEDSNSPEEGTSITAQVVLALMDGFLNKGYILYADNFYNSVPLTKTLTSQNTYLCGTLRSNRKDNPKQVVSLVSQKLLRGELSYLRSDSVIVCKWKDKRDVLTISNMHEVEIVDVPNRNGKISKKRNIVRDYNLGMGGIDRADQMMSYYSAERKTVRWYKKLGIHFIEIFIQNAYWMYTAQQHNKKTDLLSFRETIVKYLAGKPTRGNSANNRDCKKEKFDHTGDNFHLFRCHSTYQKQVIPNQTVQNQKVIVFLANGSGKTSSFGPNFGLQSHTSQIETDRDLFLVHYFAPPVRSRTIETHQVQFLNVQVPLAFYLVRNNLS